MVVRRKESVREGRGKEAVAEEVVVVLEVEFVDKVVVIQEDAKGDEVIGADLNGEKGKIERLGVKAKKQGRTKADKRPSDRFDP